MSSLIVGELRVDCAHVSERDRVDRSVLPSRASRELGSVGRIYLVVASADSRGWLLRHTDGRDGGRTRGHFSGLRLGLDDRHGGPMTSPCLDDRRVSGKARS